MTLEAKPVNKLPTPKPLTNLQNSTTPKPKIVKQKDKIVAVNSDRDREKGTQNNEKQSADISSTTTSASTRVKTILSKTSRTNHQADVTNRLGASKAETSSSKN